MCLRTQQADRSRDEQPHENIEASTACHGTAASPERDVRAGCE
jgi:hypothetical protein